MSHLTFRRTVAAAALAVVGLTACDSGDPVVSGDSTTSLSILLTDAPGAVEAAWVDIDEIYLQGGGGGRLTLLDEPTGLVELTSLAGTTRTLVQDMDVSAATYGQLRMVVSAAVLETKDGDVYTMGGAEHPDGLEATGDLQCPSCSQSGLKVIIPGDDVPLEEGAMAVVLDFDVAQTFGHKAGNSGKWVMKPTIHGTLVDDVNGDGVPDLDQTGSLEGTVVLGTDVVIPQCPAGTDRSLTDFIPMAVAQTLTDGDGQPVVRTGAVNESGDFAIPFLSADTYSLDYQAQLDFEGASLVFGADVSPAQSAVADGPVTGIAYTITSATCQVSGG